MYLHRRLPEAEEHLRHALTVLEFVEGKVNLNCRGQGQLEVDIKQDLAKLLLRVDRDEEAGTVIQRLAEVGPLIQRLRELAAMAWADPLMRVDALDLAVDFQFKMGDVEQAKKDMEVLPSEPISHPPSRDSRHPDPTVHLHHKPQPAS